LAHTTGFVEELTVVVQEALQSARARRDPSDTATHARAAGVRRRRAGWKGQQPFWTCSTPRT